MSDAKDSAENLPFHKRFMLNHRRILAPIIPAVVVCVLWLGMMISSNDWHLFNTKYLMSITMIFGSLIAGSIH